MGFPSPPDSSLVFRGAEFDPRKFYDLLSTQGTRVDLWPAVECPCYISSETDQPRRDCTVCDGKRFEYPAGLRVSARAIFQDLGRDRDLQAKHGDLFIGTGSFTLRGEYALPDHSYIILTDAFVVLQRIRQRAASGTTDTLRDPIIVPSGLIVGPTAADTATSGVMYVRKATATGLGGDVLVEGTDFAVTDAGAIDWTLGVARGTAPAAGGAYSITYYAKPRYVVERAPHVVRMAEVKLARAAQTRAVMPTQVFARLDNRTIEVP